MTNSIHPVALGGTCTVSGVTAPADVFSLVSQPTRMGNRIHVVTTTDRDFAFAIFEQALEVDIEPDFTYAKGNYSVEFICDDVERDAAIEAAKAGVPTC